MLKLKDAATKMKLVLNSKKKKIYWPMPLKSNTSVRRPPVKLDRMISELITKA